MKQIIILMLCILLVPLVSGLQQTDNLFYRGSTNQSWSSDIVLNLPINNLTSNNTYIKDYSVVKNNITFIGNNIFNNSNNAYDFNGTSQAINIYSNNAINLTTANNFTISLWVYPIKNTTSLVANIISFRPAALRGIGIQYEGDGEIVLITRNATVIGEITATGAKDSEWVHVVGTYNTITNNVSFYINSTYIGTATAALTLVPTSATIGGSSIISGNSRNFNGSVSNVLIFNRTLSAVEIKRLYDYQRVQFEYVGSKDYLLSPPPVVAPQRANRFFNYLAYNNTVYNYNILDTNLMLSLPMRNYTSTSTYTRDYSLNNYNSTLYNMTFNTSDNSYLFSGINNTNNITLMNITTTNTTPLSISVWFKLGQDGINYTDYDSQPIIAFGYVRLYDRYDNNMLLVRTDGIGSNEAQYLLGKGDTVWHHAVGTFNGNRTISLYVDGNYKSTASGGVTLHYGYAVGALVGNRRSFNGSISNVLIFNRTLSANEIYRLYKDGRNQ